MPTWTTNLSFRFEAEHDAVEAEIEKLMAAASKQGMTFAGGTTTEQPRTLSHQPAGAVAPMAAPMPVAPAAAERKDT